MIGETLSHYHIVEQLGVGGMGVVYKADDVRLKRPVALKLLPLELTSDPEAKQRLIHEAQAASALDHPNICVIHEIDETPDGRVFVAMAYYEGETLKQRINHGPLDIDQATDIATQVARALAVAHEAGIVHRDVKPANIMVTRRGEVKLLDFGIARLSGQTRLTRTGTTLGTVAYMAPELIAGGEADARSDVWALGVVLSEMLTGRLPFRGEQELALMNAVINENPRSVRELRPEVPVELDRIITRALEKDPNARDASARELLERLTALRPPAPVIAAAPARPQGLWRAIGRPRGATIALLVLLVVATGGVWSIVRARNVRWATETALPEIRRLVAADDHVAAMAVAKDAERVLKNDPALARMWAEMSVIGAVHIRPAGAAVYVRDAGLRHEWQYLGQTPIEQARLPRGVVRWKFEKAGFETAEFIALAGGVGSSTGVELATSGSVPRGMVRIPASNLTVTLIGYNLFRRIPSAEYFIDEHEVTNKEFKEFIDAGGYQKHEYWKQPFIKDGRAVSWEDAMALFRDQTGRPGPSTWEVGTYANGRDDYPVGGVSWYEAAAYAESRRKSLPTVYHWTSAAGTYWAAQITPASNFNGAGPLPVRRSPGISPYGLYDVAGNVKEWCSNEMPPESRRYILGGGWNEPDYMFRYADARSPFDRSAQNGFRCAKYPKPESLPAETTRPLERRIRDYRDAKPVSDEIFRVYTSLYAYDPAPLEARVERIDDSPAAWRRERISFNAAYGKERVIAQLFLPKRGRPPYQTVLYWPGTSVLRTGSSDDGLAPSLFDFLLLSGRAVLVPVYLGMLDRYDGRGTSWPEMTRAYRDWVMKQVNDARRALDYAESRSDVKRETFGYFGFSWGANMGSLVLALEPRLRAAVLVAGGFRPTDVPPEVDPLNFAPPVSVPVLMINGDADLNFEVDQSQKPLFQFLGTPPDRKRHLVLRGGHAIIYDARSQVIREMLDWFDRYLGVVQ